MKQRAGNTRSTIMIEDMRETARDRDELSSRPGIAAECDIVMKGGITSGIVYPGAIATLATHYRFRSIGGTSAGAIAAAAAAAAELGRASGGFDKLAALPKELGEIGRDGSTRLLGLFSAEPRTASLYQWLVAGLMPDKRRRTLAAWRWFVAAIANFPLAALAAFVLCAICTYFALRGHADALAVVAAVLLAIPVFVLVLALWIVVTGAARIAENGYGLCSGMGGATCLTPWLYAKLQTLADLPPDRPLTFGDLWTAGSSDADRERALAETHRRRIDLRLMTTALSHGRPYSFPLELNDFHFDADELRRLFPPAVVDHLIACAGAPLSEGPLAGKYRLCRMADLPIVVPVRMSLAFPLLLSAVPLHRVRHDPDREHPGEWLHVAEKVWFSDGGVCSNFPIHFFDATLPSRPTFGINLTDDRFVREHARDPEDYVWMPAHNGSGITTKIVEVERRGRASVLGFLGALVETMQDWSDSTQLGAPGFRDRIVHVRLTADEGGLNLRMRPELIHTVAARGVEAARVLLAHYAHADPPPDTVTGWRNHRWVRYRVAMRLIEQALEGLRVAEHDTSATSASIRALHADPPSYRFKTPAQEAAALAAYEELLALADRYAGVRDDLGYAIFEHDTGDGPHPRPELRIRPRL
ncbi:MAG TPA: patatin-like phospholipase family protein [Rhodanobacteraceae bacterium]|nr:patatin-like phospholipase family protein [Rhodanobacteraceae bacterium]